jgi:hypothetical protein
MVDRREEFVHALPIADMGVEYRIEKENRGELGLDRGCSEVTNVRKTRVEDVEKCERRDGERVVTVGLTCAPRPERLSCAAPPLQTTPSMDSRLDTRSAHFFSKGNSRGRYNGRHTSSCKLRGLLRSRFPACSERAGNFSPPGTTNPSS